MKFSVIGLNWGKNYIRTLNVMGHSVKIVCSRTRESYNKCEFKPLNPHFWTNNYKEAINSNDIDAVIIATPPNSHKEIALEAIKANKHIIIEKPFTLNYKDAIEISEAAARYEKNIMVGYLHLWQPKFRAICDTFYGDLDFDTTIHTEGFGWGPFRNYSMLWDYGSHDIAMVLHFMHSMPNKVKVINDNTYFSDISHANMVTIHLEFSYVHTNCWINIGNKSFKHRNFFVKNGFGTWHFQDDFKGEPLKYMLEDFINNKVNNLMLARDVTTVLDQIDNSVVSFQ